MKTVFNSHRELTHIWASRSQDFGKAGNVSFNKDVINSYHWWPMAKFVGDNIVLIRNWSYSSSTSKHLSLVRSAIPEYYKRVYVYDPTDSRDNIKDFMNKIKLCFDSFPKSKKYKGSIYRDQQDIINNMVEYCRLFNLTLPDFNDFSLEKDIYMSEITKQEEHLVELKAKKEKKRLEIIALYGSELTALENNWILGTTNRTHIWDKIAGQMYFSKIRLRAKDDNIQTSLGANVPIREAKVLYDMIQHKDNIHGHKIGSYTVIGINGTLKIGCHEIERDEINRIAELLHW